MSLSQQMSPMAIKVKQAAERPHADTLSNGQRLYNRGALLADYAISMLGIASEHDREDR